MALFALAALAIGLSGAATAASVVQGRKSAKAQRQANEVSRKIESRQMQRERMQALREAQILRAQGQQMAANTGALDSSGFAGQQAGITAQTNSNIAFSQQVDTGTAVVSRYSQQAADAGTKAGNWAALAQLSLMASSAISSPTSATKANKPTT